jgi:hypothetical protein
MTNIKIPISVGELIDKLSILKIKMEKINDSEKLVYITEEFNLLRDSSNKFLEKKNIGILFDEIYEVNKKLWQVEDLIREKEKNNEFDSEFIQLARKVYITNDLRFKLKNEINNITNSKIKEQKNF